MTLASWSFTGSWRHYQQECLEAFEADRSAGRHQTLLVAPPGSGKTVIGLEIVRRVGAPTLVLCPTQTIQSQWQDKQSLFGAPSPDLHALTYQSLCQTGDPDDMLRDAATRQWSGERAAVTGSTVEEVETETAAWTGEAATRRQREIAAILAGYKRSAARGEFPELSAAELLSPTVRARVAELRAAGVRTVVLDECHHLVSMWGALMKVVLAELTPDHILGLTATNPRELTAEQASLYRELLDEEDFSIPTPAVVREGFLAPYQELVQLCSPLHSEHEWLAQRHARFDEALEAFAPSPAGHEHLGLDVWLLQRIAERRTAAGAQLSWAEFAKRQPTLAGAGLRWLRHTGRPPPEGAPRGEQFRAAITLDDWTVLLDDYATRCLRPDASDEAGRRLAELQVALEDLGHTLTRQGIRRSGGEVDRVLLNSAAKPMAMCDVLATESDARGPALRALVLCDSERPPRQPEGSPLQLTGGGRGLLAAIGADDRLTGTRPALVTGSTFAVLPVDADWWVQRLHALAREDGLDDDQVAGLRVEQAEGIGVLRCEGAGFTSRRWTDWATRLLGAGETQTLLGTRGLLGEGWDCPQVNVLVDMTAVAADISVRQMRGRSLRLDPGDPDKLASNWDVVCVAPTLGRGHADYGRFVRRHSHLHAPCEDGTIETGTSHVHPELSPYGPPAEERFVAINVEQQDRAADRDAARRRWGVGQPYRGVDLDALVVRNPARAGDAALANVSLGSIAPLARGWWTAPLTSIGIGARRRYPAELPLEWGTAAVCGAYVALGELTSEAMATAQFAVRPEGWVRISLPDASVPASRAVSAAVDELLGGAGLPRYAVSRRAVVTWRPATVWHPVPSDLARHRDRAEAFRAAWSRWVGKAELVYCHGQDPRAGEVAVAAGDGVALETQRRRVWG